MVSHSYNCAKLRLFWRTTKKRPLKCDSGASFHRSSFPPQKRFVLKALKTPKKGQKPTSLRHSESSITPQNRPLGDTPIIITFTKRIFIIMQLIPTHSFIQHTVQDMALLFEYCISHSPVAETHGNQPSPATRKIRQIFIQPRTPEAKNYYLYFKLCRYLCYLNRSADLSGGMQRAFVKDFHPLPRVRYWRFVRVPVFQPCHRAEIRNG